MSGRCLKNKFSIGILIFWDDKLNQNSNSIGLSILTVSLIVQCYFSMFAMWQNRYEPLWSWHHISFNILLPHFSIFFCSCWVTSELNLSFWTSKYLGLQSMNQCCFHLPQVIPWGEEYLLKTFWLFFQMSNLLLDIGLLWKKLLQKMTMESMKTFLRFINIMNRSE